MDHLGRKEHHAKFEQHVQQEGYWFKDVLLEGEIVWHAMAALP